MQPILEVKQLTKRFKNFTAVNNISFSIKEGEIVGLLGPNGAGKTTTLQMLLGILTPTKGEISYFGKKLTEHETEIKNGINFSSTYTQLPWNLTVKENLTFISYLYNIKDRKKRIANLIEIFRLKDIINKQISELSAGQKTRVNLAKSLINYPKVLLLDEPTASLDPEVAVFIREFLHKQREQFNVTILITSHNMVEVEELCDRVIFLYEGKIIADDNPYNLAKTLDITQIKLHLNKGINTLINYLDKENIQYEKENKTVIIDIKEKEVASFIQKLADHNIYYDEISILRPSLEDYFLNIAKKITDI